MKGFPNQVADLPKLSAAMQVLTVLVDEGLSARDDGVFGQALVRAGIAGTGHQPAPIEQYIRQQLKKPVANQSFRTTARGLRELFRLLGFINDGGNRVAIRNTGRVAASFSGRPLAPDVIAFWRQIIPGLSQVDARGRTSHPYQVLLNLVARNPGITRAKCALALEAADDSDGELDRIGVLARRDEAQILRELGISKSNWDNAKKVLPKFAEQLGDVIKHGDAFWIARGPGQAGIVNPARAGADIPRRPRGAREVDSTTIAMAGTVENFDETKVAAELNPEANRSAIAKRLDRLRRHNLIVKSLARRLTTPETTLYEDPFDILAIVGEVNLLAEIKTLDGSVADEQQRVREALAQLLYYETFLRVPLADGSSVHKIACFEKQVSADHQTFLQTNDISTIWCADSDRDRFEGNELAADMLGRHLREFR